MTPPVSHLVISLAPGGLERLVVDWTNARNRNHSGKTRIICLDELGGLSPQVENGMVQCIGAKRSRFPWDWAAVRSISDLLGARHSMPGARYPVLGMHPVIHAHNLSAWQYGVLVKLFWKRKVTLPVPRLIYTQHGANVHNMSLVNRLRARLLAIFTDEMAAVSEATADVVAKTLWLSRKRIRVVVNGVSQRANPESGIGNPEIRRKMGIPADAFVIGSVGRLAQVKGYDRLIAAFAAVIGHSLSVIGEKAIGDPSTSNQDPITNNGVAGACLLLVGDGPERAELERQARELGVDDRVFFAGFQSNPEPYYSAMNLFVLSSRSEGLSISLLEAMSNKVPVAVTDVGANREVVADGRCGWLLPEDDGDWPAVLSSIMTHPDGPSAKVMAALKRVRERYSLDATLRAYEALYGQEQSKPVVRQAGK